jgi:pimeloyl-ACP methyl ester carboxylesterase
MTTLPRPLLVLLVTAAGCMPPSWAANAMLHPGRRPAPPSPTRPFQAVDLVGAGVHLKGWRFRAEGPVRRGTVIYLHGIGDNRGSSLGVAAHFVPLGFDVLAYDSRAHGQSEGDACTYGVFEKQDLLRVLETIEARPVILLGVSLGAAVALQAAAQGQGLKTVIAISTYSDLSAVAHDRAPFFASEGNIQKAFRLAEAEGHFRVDDASPQAAAGAISVPVLLIHGAKDVDTPPVHSQRVLERLHTPKRLYLVPGAGHDNTFDGTVWPQIDDWLRTLPS